MSPSDKYGQHDQTNEYSQPQQQDHKNEYGMHSPTSARQQQVLKDAQTLVKSEPTNQQTYAPLPPFLN